MYTSHTTLLLVTIFFFFFILPSSSLPSAVRKAHNSGRNHLANVRDYYACEYYPRTVMTLHHLISFAFTIFLALGHDKAQSIIDQITSAYESGGGPPPGGFGFGPQHLTSNGSGFGPPPGYGGPPAGFRTS
jgi:U1 small nuclear ribonucleoprotein C